MNVLLFAGIVRLPALTDLKSLAGLLGSPLPTFESKVEPRVSRFTNGITELTADYESVPLVIGRVYTLESNFDHMFRGRDSSFEGVLTSGSAKFLVGRPRSVKEEIKPGIVDFKEEAVSEASLVALTVEYKYSSGSGVKKAKYQSSWYRWGDWRTKFQFSGQTYLRTRFNQGLHPSIKTISGTGSVKAVSTPVLAVGRVLSGFEALFVLEQVDPAGINLLSWRENESSYAWNPKCRIDDLVVTKVILRHSSLIGWFSAEPGVLNPLSSEERLYTTTNLSQGSTGNQFRASGAPIDSPNSIPGEVSPKTH